nr:hypothetical protein [Paucisalibacillus globulus]
MGNDLVIKVIVESDNVSKNMLSFIEELVTISTKITIEKPTLERTSRFRSNHLGEEDLGTIEEILSKLGSSPSVSELYEEEPYDLLIVGGGPSGASAAINALRKGNRTGIVTECFGGQVLDTLSKENFISVTTAEGPKLVVSVKQYIKDYSIDIFNLQRVNSIEKNDDILEVELKNGVVLKSRSVIVS